MPDETTRAYRIEGRVQGVGFRWWVLEEARSRGLRGTVRNRPDGTVELHLAGAARAVEQMEAALPDGPPAAEVHRLVPIDPGPIPDGFEIVR